MKDMKNIIKIILVFVLVWTTTSCDKDFLEVNTDPNYPSASTVQLVLPVAISSSAYVIGGGFQILGGMWSQHYTQAMGGPQYRFIDEYRL